jgi:alpha-galactosidase
MKRLQFEGIEFETNLKNAIPINGAYRFEGIQVNIALPKQPKLYYLHGWQSWSMTAWIDPAKPIPIQKPFRLHPLQTDPLYSQHPAPNGSWLGAVEFEHDQILLLGSLCLEAHVALHEQDLHGWNEAGNGEWFLGYGTESAVFAQYAELLKDRLGSVIARPAPRVWCSWYSLYGVIDEFILGREFRGLDDLPFDVLQVDDGWQVSVGDWTPNEKFPSGMSVLAERIRATNRIPGLWLAPFLAVPSSRLYREHNNWLLRNPEGELVSAGFLWGEPLFTLDTTIPGVQEWLRLLMQQVRSWGYDYVKLDFLFAGALPGNRYSGIPREAAYRQGLQAMREGLGNDAYLLTCGAPILPSLGLCDAIRIGPDVSGTWESFRDSILLQNPSTPGVKNAIRTSVNRLWLGKVLATDPDVCYFTNRMNRLSVQQKRLLQDLAMVCDFKATSDLPAWWSDQDKEELRSFLETKTNVERLGRARYKVNSREVDFSAAMSAPEPARGLNILASAVLGWVGNQTWAMRLLNWLGKRSLNSLKKEISRGS